MDLFCVGTAIKNNTTQMIQVPNPGKSVIVGTIKLGNTIFIN